MKKTGYPEYLYILSLNTFDYDGFFPFLIICVIRQVDEAFIGVSFSVCMNTFVLKNSTGVLDEGTKSCLNRGES
jgi:hypothetical protein